MRSESWFARNAWIWFALVTGSVLPLALVSLFDPGTAVGTWERFGYDLPAAVVADGTAMEYVEFISHWAVTGTLGFDLFGLAIAVTAFRRREKWAWLVFWYWPVMFLIHFFTYQSGFRYAQLVWLSVSVAALAVTYPAFWKRPATAPTEAAVR